MNIQFISTRKKILGLRTVNSVAIQPFKFVHSVSFRSYAGITLVRFSFWESKQVDKTDLTNVLVSVFKNSDTGMGHFGEMHFPSFSQPPF